MKLSIIVAVVLSIFATLATAGDWTPIKQYKNKKGTVTTFPKMVYPPDGVEVLFYCRMVNTYGPRYEFVIGTRVKGQWVFRDSKMDSQVKYPLAWRQFSAPDPLRLNEHK